MGVNLPTKTIEPRAVKLSSLKALTAARLVPKKGHDTLIRAIALARSQGVTVELECFGEGPLRRQLKQLAADLGVSDLITFHGNVSHSEVLSAMRDGTFDAAVLTSVTTQDGDKEGIPVFLMEAMAAGMPVIATKHAGIPELVTPECGILVPEFDAEATATAMVAFAENFELRQRFASNGRQIVENRFCADTNSARLRELINSSAN